MGDPSRCLQSESGNRTAAKKTLLIQCLTPGSRGFAPKSRMLIGFLRGSLRIPVRSAFNEISMQRPQKYTEDRRETPPKTIFAKPVHTAVSNVDG